MAGSHTFSFDRVFGPNTSQADAFIEIAKPVVDGTLPLIYVAYHLIEFE